MSLSDSDFAGLSYDHQPSVGVNEAAQAYGFGLSVPGACQHCSSSFQAVIHGGPCPRIKAIEYHPNGAVKRIEYKDGR